MEFTNVVEFEGVTVDGETQPGHTNHGAIKCMFPENPVEPIWIPKSQVDDRSDVYKSGQIGTLMISEWIAGEKGLI